MGITRKITENINALVEMKIVIKFSTVQLCRKVNLLVSNFHYTLTCVQHVSYSKLLLEECYTKSGVLRFRCASWPWDVCRALHRAAQHHGHLSETPCGVLPTCPLDFFPKERRARRILPWSVVKDHQPLQCVRGAHLQSAQSSKVRCG